MVVKRPVLIALVVGIVLGATGAVLAPRLVSPHLPRSGDSDRDGVTGIVLAKSKEADRLLMTVAGEEGAVLVTVTKRIKEIDLLVDVGDRVTLEMSGYRPFVNDPTIGAVHKTLIESTQIEGTAQPQQPGSVTQPAALDSTRAPGPTELDAPVDTSGTR